MELKIAKTSDVDEIMKICDGAKERMREEKIPQWQKGYPNREIYEEDARNKTLFSAFDGEISGAATFIVGKEADYEEIDGGWLTKGENYLTVHRLAVKTEKTKRGVASFLFSEAEKIAESRGLLSLRCDTHEKNMPMRKALEKAGFSYCGKITLKGDTAEKGEKRVAYEKVLRGKNEKL